MGDLIDIQLNRRNLLKATGVSVLSFFLKGNAQGRKPDVVAADTIEERLIKDDFNLLTEADEQTLDFLTRRTNQYYDQLDRMSARGEKLDLYNTDNLFHGIVATPLIENIFGTNDELKKACLDHFGDSLNYDTKQFFVLIGEYFKKKGYHLYFEFDISDKGFAYFVRLSTIDKITELTGNIWGNEVPKTEVIHLKKTIIPRYANRNSENRDGGGFLEGVVTIYPEFADDILFSFIKKRDKLEIKDNITQYGDLADALFIRGLSPYADNPGMLEQFRKERIRSSLMHEATHAVFHSYFHDGNQSEVEFLEAIKRNELCAFLTQLKNEPDNLTYVTINDIAIVSTDPKYEYSSNEFQFFVTNELDKNRHLYPQLDYSVKKPYLYSQIHRLEPRQIRSIAVKAFRHHFPDLIKN